MLKHEDNPKPLPSAAEARATPEELAAAITRLEARKDATQRQAEGTVPIGEVVRQLGLDTTPEEVFAEVQAERARHTSVKARRFSLRQRLGLWLATGAIVALGFAGLLGLEPRSAINPQNVTSGAIRVILPPPTQSAPTAERPVAADNSPCHIQIDPDHLQVADASGKLVLISEVRDNQKVHSVLEAGSLSFQDDSPGNFDPTWTLIKHGGKVYVRGWIPQVSNKLLQAEGVTVANHRSTVYITPITLALDGFKVFSANTGGFTDNFNAQDIRLDSHAYEKW